MAFDYSSEQAEELKRIMYSEISELRSVMSKPLYHRDFFAENAIYELLQNNVYQPSPQELEQLFENH